MDIVIRHVAPNSPKALQSSDKFRLSISHQDKESEIIGKKDIIATLHSGTPPEGETSIPRNNQKSIKSAQQTLDFNSMTPQFNLMRDPTPNHQPNYVACLAALICIAALFIPTEGESKDGVFGYPWLVLTVNQKLVFSYVLGLVTMAILRNT